MSKTGTFHLNSGIYRDFPNVNFRPTLTLQKVFKGYFRVLCENSYQVDRNGRRTIFTGNRRCALNHHEIFTAL